MKKAYIKIGLSTLLFAGLVMVKANACILPDGTYREFGDELGAELRKAEKLVEDAIEARTDMTDEQKSELDDYFSDEQDDWATYARSHCLASVVYQKGAEDENLEQVCLSKMARQRLKYLKTLYKK